MAAVLPSGRLAWNIVLVQATRIVRAEPERYPLSSSSMALQRAAACEKLHELH